MSVRFLRPAYLRANAIAGLIALAVWMAIDGVYVLFVRQSSLYLRISWPAVVLVGVVVFVYANWRLASGPPVARLGKALVLSLPTLVIWFVIGTIVLLWFHPFIGGNE